MPGCDVKNLNQLAREHTEAAMGTLVEIMENSMEESRDRLRAAVEILDRGHGKAAQAVVMVPADPRQARRAAALYTDAELDSIIDAEFEVRGERETRSLPAPQKDPLLA